MTPREFLRLRLVNQQLSNPPSPDPAAAVRRLCAMQAQDYPGVLWSVGLRTNDGTIEAIQKAIADRKIIRTWLLRGTLHLAAPGDVRPLLDLVAPRVIAGSAGRHRELGLTREDFGRSREVFADLLAGGGQMTREELFNALDKAGISPAGQRGYHLLAMAGLAGLICFGNPRGKEQTFVLLDEWAPPAGDTGTGTGPAWLAERYFAGHGPASLQDFAWWSGFTISAARAALDGAETRLQSVTFNGTRYFLAPGTGEGSGEPASCLLPGFDEYMLGYRDRSAMLDPSLAKRTVISANGMMLPIIVIDGTVAGTWKRTIGKRDIVLSLAPFSPLDPAAKRSVAEAAERYAAFMGMPVTTSWHQER